MRHSARVPKRRSYLHVFGIPANVKTYSTATATKAVIFFGVEDTSIYEGSSDAGANLVYTLIVKNP